jgi:hypothetical protein
LTASFQDSLAGQLGEFLLERVKDQVFRIAIHRLG